jgi:hypothetical protein
MRKSYCIFSSRNIPESETLYQKPMDLASQHAYFVVVVVSNYCQGNKELRANNIHSLNHSGASTD